MRRTLLLLIGLLLLPTTLSAYQKGIALGLYEKDPSYSYEQDLKEIKKLGADHISLVVSWYQKDIRSNEIYPRWKAVGDFETIRDEKLAEVIRQAHRTGLKVMLFPILRIEERKEKEWRGAVAPTDLKKWLQSLRLFTLHYARLGARHGVELFSVGSELCSMEKEEDYWKKLITEIRSFFRGDLLYSANWDHYKKVTFWDDLDYLGLNGYYEIAVDSTPRLEDLIRSWWDIENQLAAWQEQRRKKIIFTEIGYPSIDGGCQKPWDYTREAPIDLQEQALCYEAFFRTWGKSSRLGGVYFWNWYGQGGENDRSYTPRGKPAQAVLNEWFQESSSLSSQSSSLSPADRSRKTTPSVVPPSSL